ncbi:leucine-rich repeat-containing G-protein coupled receptor 4-like [Aethina tumida]|uniref:leucine-rich repeat-containing G-protein coupled receptor 4-like n=1 Tax=Aethina tumida TaxID=116153 RepID=UPI00096B5031|nr:leucine-rich repeat-containing G-protein coupled receptor 4-like [Aethina tumida]
MLQRIVLLVSLFSALFDLIVTAQRCEYLRNITVTVFQENGDPYNQTINGCIEDVVFSDEKNVVTAITISNQNITHLGEYSVRNMAYINEIIIENCVLQSIEAGAFSNLPKLSKITLGFSELKDVAIDVFNVLENLQEIRIHNTDLDTIDKESFANMPLLRKFSSDINKLEYYDKDWFTNSVNLEILDFQFNKINSLPEKAFYNLKKLRKVNFNNNEISYIEPNAFEGLDNLDTLYLNYNRLKIINDDIVPDKLKIASLYINANYLNYLSNALLKKVSVKQISLDYNPWKCPCLDRINYWLNEINGTTIGTHNCTGYTPMCLYSKNFTNTCLDTIDEDLTTEYIHKLRNATKFKTDLNPYCARLD